MTRLTTLCVVLTLLLATAVVAPAAGQASPQPTTTEANSTETDRQGTRIDGDLRLVSTSYDGSGTATLTFETDSAKAVTLADAGGFVDGGRINRRTLVFDEAGTHTVDFDVTESDRGYVGVSIATDDVLYAEVIRSPSISPFRSSTGTVGWFAGAGIVLVSFVGAALWKLRKEGGAPVEASP
jgi:hypothetical protein